MMPVSDFWKISRIPTDFHPSKSCRVTLVIVLLYHHTHSTISLRRELEKCLKPVAVSRSSES